MRLIVCVLLACACMFLCPLAHSSAEVRIVTTFYPAYIMAKNVVLGIEGISVENLTPPVTGCLHEYAVTADDMKKLAHADVLVANGAGMETFLRKIVAHYPRLAVIELSQGIDFIPAGKDPNPHVWLSIDGAIAQVRTLGDTLARDYPVYAERVQENTRRYVAQLEDLRRQMHAKLDSYKGRAIVTFHEAFPYFAREFGLRIVGVVEREPGSAPSAREMAHTIALIKKTGAKAIFAEPQYPAKAAMAIAREAGAQVYVLDPAVTGPDECDAYVRIMQRNADTLYQAFQQ